ncbi:MAG: hypothetical protein WD534_12580 [Phycisphaeraceae bacterium]
MADASTNPTGPITLLCSAGDVTIEAAATTETGDADTTSGGLPRFSMVAYSGEPMRVEGWRHPVVVDLEGLRIESQRKPIRFAHSAYQGVGHTERIVADGGRLIAEGVVSRDTPAAREVVSSGKRGFPWQASIGAAVEQAEFIKPGTTVTVNGRTFPGPVFVARQTVLGEISFVDAGADRNTSASIAAQADKDNIMSENTNDHGQHSDPADDTATAPASSKGADVTSDTEDRRSTEAASTVTASAESNGSVTPPQDTDDHIAAMRTLTATELRRQSKIRQVAADHPEIAAKAIEEGWSGDKAELEVLRASRPKVTGGGGPAMHSIDSTIDGHVLEAACMLTGGIGQPEKVFEERTLEAAQRRFRGGIGLQELLLEAAWANGYSGRNFRASREVLRYAFAPAPGGGGSLPGVQASSLSTIDIGGILSNVANKFLLDGFFSVERTWRNICSVRNVSDFKTVTSYRLIGTDQYEQVAPGGELKHGTLGEDRAVQRQGSDAQPRNRRGGRHHARQQRLAGDAGHAQGRQHRVRDGLGHAGQRLHRHQGRVAELFRDRPGRDGRRHQRQRQPGSGVELHRDQLQPQRTIGRGDHRQRDRQAVEPDRLVRGDVIPPEA